MNATGTLSESPSSGRCPLGEQRGPGHYPETAIKWTKEVNGVVMKCYFREKNDENRKPIRGYRRIMMREWSDLGGYKENEQSLCDQVRYIRNDGVLPNLKLEAIKREIAIEESQDQNLRQ